MTEQWRELKNTITEIRDNNGTGTQQEVCKFLSNYMDVLEKQMQEPKTGKWIEERTYMECPNCHDIWHYEENQTARFKFCPTCGKRIK